MHSRNKYGQKNKKFYVAGQLLSLILQNERPELETKRTCLLRKEEELRLEISDIEKQLLHSLACSKGNILDNADLLQSLNDTKVKNSTIFSSLQQSEALHRDLDGQREVFRPVANK